MPDTSLQYRQWINGGLPTLVRMGLYAGLRDIEMVWFSWSWIDWHHRVLNLGETICQATGQRWIPKSHEARSLDVKTELIDFLEDERKGRACSISSSCRPGMLTVPATGDDPSVKMRPRRRSTG